MKFEKKVFEEVEKPLKTIRRRNNTGISLTQSRGFNSWWDVQEGEVALSWITPGALAVAKAVAEFHYPFIERPITEYRLSVLESDEGLRTTYEVNSFNRHRTIFKYVSDANADLSDFENHHESFALANSLGINSMTIEDLDVVRGLVQRRIADL